MSKGEGLPAKLGTLLFNLPNIIDLTVNVSIEKSSQFVNALKLLENGNAHTTATNLPTIRFLTIQSNEWQFLTALCPNVESLTVNETFRWLKTLLLDIKALGKTHPQLKRLHCYEPCKRVVLEGKIIGL